MSRTTILGSVLIATVFIFTVSGCSPGTPNSQRAADSPEHAHATHGPHGGELIELGSEEYHAELVHNEQSGAVTIYILDASGKSAVSIDAADLTINLKHDGQAEQFKLAASPDANDPPGKSSRFTSNEAELGEDLEHAGAEPHLVATINGKQYRGTIQHGEHDHEGGGHEQ